MDRFPFLLLQVFSVFPFEITKKKKIIYSKLWHFWGRFLTLIVIVASVLRVYILSNEPLESDDFGLIYTFLSKYEPHFDVVGITLQGFIIFWRPLFNMLKKYVQTITTSSTSETNLAINKMTVGILTYICVLAISLQTFLSPPLLDVAFFLDIWISVGQTTYNLMHFLHYYAGLYIINYHLNEIEKEIRGIKSRPDNYWVLVENNVIERLDQILHIYKYFSKIYYLFIKLIFSQIFFETLLGLKYIEDLFHSKLTTVGTEIVMIVWHLFGCPLLFVTIHQGHLFQERVSHRRLNFIRN